MITVTIPHETFERITCFNNNVISIKEIKWNPPTTSYSEDLSDLQNVKRICDNEEQCLIEVRRGFIDSCGIQVWGAAEGRDLTVTYECTMKGNLKKQKQYT